MEIFEFSQGTTMNKMMLTLMLSPHAKIMVNSFVSTETLFKQAGVLLIY